MTSRPDSNDSDLLTADDEQWLLELFLDLWGHDEVGAARAGELRDVQRAALIELRRDERVEGRDPVPAVEAFGETPALARELLTEHLDVETLAEQERQGLRLGGSMIGLVGACAVMTTLGAAAHVVSGRTWDPGRSVLLIGAGAAVLLGREALRSWVPGARARAAAAGAAAVVVLVGGIVVIRRLPESAPAWIGVLAGLALLALAVVMGRNEREDLASSGRTDADGVPHDRESWLRALESQLRWGQSVSRRERRRVLASTAELLDDDVDPVAELGTPGAWARRILLEDPGAARSHEMRSGLGGVVLGLLLLIASVLGVVAALQGDGPDGWTGWAVLVLMGGAGLVFALGGALGVHEARRMPRS